MGKNAYTTKQVADNIGVGTSTLRKWCLLLEDENGGNYQFERNEKDQRIFYDHDVLALRTLKKLTQEDGVTLDNAVKSIGNKARSRKDMTDSDTEEGVLQSDIMRYEEKIDRLMEYIERQEERFDRQERFNRELIAKLDEQQRYINKSIDHRDQKLLESIREIQEGQRLIAAAKQEQKEEEDTRSQQEEPKGFFAKLFGK